MQGGELGWNLLALPPASHPAKPQSFSKLPLPSSARAFCWVRNNKGSSTCSNGMPGFQDGPAVSKEETLPERGLIS